MPVLQEQPENVQFFFLLQESILNLFLFCESRNNNSAFLYATALVAKELNLLFLTFRLGLRTLYVSLYRLINVSSERLLGNLPFSSNSCTSFFVL